MISFISLMNVLKIGSELTKTTDAMNINTPFQLTVLIWPIIIDPNAAPKLPDPSRIPLTVPSALSFPLSESPLARSAAAVAATILNIPPTKNPTKKMITYRIYFDELCRKITRANQTVPISSPMKATGALFLCIISVILPSTILPMMQPMSFIIAISSISR